ncbi:SRPBCC family protein [Alteromonas sp. a30]|uniref:SRPBCC family protein n=1 Tax=Alteromonas sp. a30 TaxID=2730917 RepID=UPI00228234F4|nr:SRPBCC family protein [Alteromonas sp. a30]MCY7296671.1 SRPBCC domain-containing protein [Alteromonas sp. a30]
MRPLILDVTLSIPLQTVYDAFISPELLQQWFRPLGMTVQQAMSNPTEEGKFVLRLSDDMNNIHTLEGYYLKVIPNQRLQFTWHWLDEDHKSQVEINFTEINEGTTQIQLKHSNFDDEEDYNLHYQAWIMCLEELSVVLGGLSAQH